MVAACYATIFGLQLGIDQAGWTALLLTQALVLSLELVNTAVEAAVDLCCPEKNPLAKRAKDAAAGAVLVAAAFSVAVGFHLFWGQRLLALATHILTSPQAFISLTVSIALAAWFIFGFKEKIEKNEV